MDVINFSGGGPETDPSNDALVEAVDNVAAAGVVPVISAGNDRDDFGLGSVGSPGTAPDAISVAAVSNAHVFARELTVTAPAAPAGLQHVPVRVQRSTSPSAWADPGQDARRRRHDHRHRTASRSTGTSAAPPGTDPNDPRFTTLPRGSLQGLDRARLARQLHVRLEGRRARGRQARAGIVLVDNRFGEANCIRVELGIPGGMISDLDGAGLRAFADAHGGRTTFRVSG